ncbi:hypothetical protein Tco_0464222 [Tanacetum coccineum]
MLDKYLFMKRLPKKWKEISICARKNEGGQNLEIYKRFAQDALNVYLWQEGTQNFDVTISRVGRRGFGNGGGLVKEITDMEEVFNQMKTEVEKCFVERKCFEIKEKELLIENERLLEHILDQDVMCIAMHAHVVHNCVLHVNDNHLAYAQMEQLY